MILPLLLTLLPSVPSPAPVPAAGDPPLHAVPFQRVHVDDAFWSPRIETNRTKTIPADLQKCEETGRLANFAVAAGLQKGEHQGFLYNDSDVYKVIEGIACSLHLHPDPALQARTDRIIDWIAAAQRKDGYLNTYVQLVKPDQRWKNLRSGHELYCAGHLIEAAIAYERATGERKLLDVAIRFADLIDRTFGPDGLQDPPGHEELELALLELSDVTGEPRYRKLAEWFLGQRGNPGREHLYGAYAQDQVPVLQQDTVVGHAVRAMYLYSAMADVARGSDDPRWRQTLERLWDDVTEKKMYVTGGIGNSAHNEGFTVPYDLPNDTAYAETCAAVGMGLWNHRMALLTREAKYADALERELYNNVLSGVSLSGDRFFYANPLEADGGTKRVPWFDCSCCPTNLTRFLPAIGGRIWAQGESPEGPDVYALNYVASEAELDVGGTAVKLTTRTDYPWDGTVSIRLDAARPVELGLHLRVPGWLRGGYSVAVDGESRRVDLPAGGAPEGSWETVRRTWKRGDEVRLVLDMGVTRVHADPRVVADRGRVAVQRGPVVYCAEGVDNTGAASALVLPPDAETRVRRDPNVLGGVPLIDAKGALLTQEAGAPVVLPRNVRLVPYHLWDNRGADAMAVWLIEDPDQAQVDDGSVVSQGDGVTVSGSHCWTTDTLDALDDGVLPSSSSDQSIPRQTFWDHRGTHEWLRYEWPAAKKVDGSAVYWFDDTGIGACRVPAGWRLVWLDGDTWRPVELVQGDYGTAADTLHAVRFQPVTTRSLRLEVDLQPDWSAGVLEWRVDAAE